MENSLLQKLKTEKTLSVGEYKLLLEDAHKLLSAGDESYNLGLAIVCHVANSRPSDTFIKQLLYDCIVESRIFLYGDMLQKSSDTYFADTLSNFSAFTEAFYALDSGTVLTKDQKKLLDEFQKTKKLIVSAPTSFGKSRIIPEIIIANKYKNVAIVLPTIALLSETFTSLKDNPNLKEYNLVNSVSQPTTQGKNILILTPEKMDLFLDENPYFKIDFFVMDEIYKIQDDPERKQIFTHALYRLSNAVSDYYLIGPYFEGFSKNFLERKGGTFLRFKTEIVQKDTHHFHELEKGEIFSLGDSELKKLKGKELNLGKLLNMLSGQTFIYVGKKQTAESLSRKIIEKKGEKIHTDLIDYIKENISKDWSLVKCLERGVAFHHNAVPRYIQKEIVDAFNDGTIQTIVCTPTLIEGVNTSAKTVIIFDNFKGKKENKLTPLDVKNIKGRAGRLSVHFVGEVITLEEVNESDVGETIDFSYFDNENLNPEESILVEKEDLLGANLVTRQRIEDELAELSIPLGVIRNNKFIPIEKQLSLIRHLRDNPEIADAVSFEGTLPTKETIDLILDLSHRYLFNEQDANDKGISFPNLKRLTKFYVYKDPSIKEIIETQQGKTVDTKVRNAFKLISRYFEFALPKYLVTFENLYNFCYSNKSKKLNLKYLVTKLEFGFAEKHEIILKDAGVPPGIIKKISIYLKDCGSLQEMRKMIQASPQILSVLPPFEQGILRKYI